MDEREAFEARQEAKRETLGRVDEATRDRIWSGLTKYLAAEARHARKEAAAEKATEKKDESRREP